MAALAYAMRWQSAFSSLPPNVTPNSTIGTTKGSLNKICPFHNSRREPPRDEIETERKIQNLQMDLQRIIENCNTQIQPNLTSKERRAITDLRNEADVVITRSDKGGEMVVMRASHLERLCLDHLGDATTYKKLEKDPSNALRIQINRALKNILTKHDFHPNFIHNLQTPTSTRTQRFYALPKTHKKELKIRPIVSACGGIFDRLGWFLQTLLKPLLENVPAHLNNTSDLLTR